MPPQTTFVFPKEQQADFKAALKAYFLDELDMEIGDLQADIFINFLNQNLGKHYYNLGVKDAIAAIKDKTADLVLLIKD